ncbi:MAG: BBP7 family outer membrane beta-barrel protein [Gemmataceae bacterium]
MSHRLPLALGILLVLAGSTPAQVPEEIPPPRTTAGPQAGPLAPYLIENGLAPQGARERFWVSGEYILGFIRGAKTPPLVTTSTDGTARVNAGVLGLASTTTLFGGGEVNNDDVRNGLRLQGGYWFGPRFGVEAGFMILESKATLFNASSDVFPILARPFTDAITGASSSQLIGFPGAAAGASTGSIAVRAAADNIYGANIDFAERAVDEGWFRLTSLFGYRYFRFDDSVRIHQVMTPIDPNFTAGTQITANDSFVTHNVFHGLDLGLRWQFEAGALSLDVLTKMAVGHINRSIDIEGDQTITAPGAAPVVRQGGLLALSSNIGSTNQGDWKVMPELGANLGWQVRSNLKVSVGYSFLLLPAVARAGEQIDTTVNQTLFPGATVPQTGPQRPALLNQRSDLWLQTINFGVVFSY